MKKLFCDIDSTINNHWMRIKRCSDDNKCDWNKAFSRAEILKDEVLPNSIDCLMQFSKLYEVHFLTARPFNNAYDITKEWLDTNGFEYSSLIVVNNPFDKLRYVTEPNCLFIDDLSRKHETNEPYKILYWDVIHELNRLNVDYELFKNNWQEITRRRLS